MVSALGAGLLLVVLVAGCQEDSNTESPGRARSADSPYLEGVPVPAGFSIVEKKVIDHESGGRRYAHHVYKGSGDLQEIRSFYRDQMIARGWTRISDRDFRGVVTIRFESRREACTVVLEPAGLFGTQVVISIDVEPFDRTPTEPPARNVP